jgi:hypothetical protein
VVQESHLTTSVDWFKKGRFQLLSSLLRPAPGGIRFGTRDFTEPRWFPNPYALPFSGIYAILVPDDRYSPRPFRVLYIGESANVRERATENHEKCNDWKREAAGKQLFVAYHGTAGMTDQQRRDAECKLINTYTPPCNTKTIGAFSAAARKKYGSS